MSSRTIVQRMANTARQYLLILNRFDGYSRADIRNDVVIRGALERYLYLSAQSAIDLCEAVIAWKGLPKPNTMSESFEILAEAGLIAAPIQESMVRMVGFRNIMTHDYVKVDYDIVYEILHDKRSDLSTFIGVIEKLL